MGEVMDFFSTAWDRLDEMEETQMADLLERVLDRLAAMDETEPEDMTSEEYEAWAERHEELEDLADELTDRLEG